MIDFLDGYTWEALLGLFFTAMFGLFPGLNVFNWLKHKFQVVDSQANALVMAASAALTVGLCSWPAHLVSKD